MAVLRGTHRSSWTAGALPVAAATIVTLAGLLLSNAAVAAGTAAGSAIDNQATATYQVGGESRSVDSNVETIRIDELLDATVTRDSAATVTVTSPASNAVLEFTLSNEGNGSETFRLVVEDTPPTGDDFDPVAAQTFIYLESNATPGLQLGAGGDTLYVAGSNDPLLAADANQKLYVVADIPPGRSANDVADIRLRAVANTLRSNAGTDDPDAVGFPAPGVSYNAAGDGGVVAAVVGVTYDTADLKIRDLGSFEVLPIAVALDKQAVNFVDPFGGSTRVPGSLVTYQITASVTGIGQAQSLLVSDPIPADLAYVSGSLLIDSAPESDAIGGADSSGFDASGGTGNGEVRVDLGDVNAGQSVVVEFQLEIQ